MPPASFTAMGVRVATKDFVGMTANLSAMAKAAARQSSATSQIMPHSLACAAPNLSPVMASAKARGKPKRPTTNQLLLSLNPI